VPPVPPVLFVPPAPPVAVAPPVPPVPDIPPAAGWPAEPPSPEAPPVPPPVVPPLPDEPPALVPALLPLPPSPPEAAPAPPSGPPLCPAPLPVPPSAPAPMVPPAAVPATAPVPEVAPPVFSVSSNVRRSYPKRPQAYSHAVLLTSNGTMSELRRTKSHLTLADRFLTRQAHVRIRSGFSWDPAGAAGAAGGPPCLRVAETACPCLAWSFGVHRNRVLFGMPAVMMVFREGASRTHVEQEV
jgi:hypothetical protein